MNKHDIIRFMGRFPDKINAEPMTSLKWKCSSCNAIYNFTIQTRIPSPCKNCNGIFFEKLT